MSYNDLPNRLQRAIESGDKGAVQALLGEGAELHVCGSWGALPLMVAARYNNPTIVEVLLDAGAGINGADEEGYTALMEAANCMVPDSLRLLIRRGAEVNARSGNGSTALIYGVFAMGETFSTPTPDDVVAILLSNGADLEARDLEGKSALDVARETGNDELVASLLKAGAS